MRFFSMIVVAACVLGAPVPAWAQSADTSWNMGKPLVGRALPCVNGKIKIFDCQNVELLSYLPPSAMGDSGKELATLAGTSMGSFDIWGWTDSATGREFTLVGGPQGTAFVEVTDPVNPRYLGTLAFHGGLEGLTGVKVYKNHAFIVAEGVAAGMQVFDLTQLRDVKHPPATFQETAYYADIGSAHTIALNPESGFAYLNGSFLPGDGETCNAGLHMVDVRMPTKPVFAGCFADLNQGAPMPGYVHDVSCVIYRGPDAQYKGREICVLASGAGVGIVDVTDKKHPKQITSATYPNVGYTHQGWFTEDQRYFFLDDEEKPAGHNTRTIVFDMMDLDEPVVLKEYFGPSTSTAHNLYIRGRYVYESNYRSGLRILDGADPANPKEVGYLDTWPDQGHPEHGYGSWGNYPYFKNNVVAVASEGLYLVRLIPPR